MMRHERRWLWYVMLTMCGFAGCVTVDYVGRSYPPTTSVDIYLSADDVKRPYETIGQARAEAPVLFSSPARELQDKLVAEARSRGADGVILSGLGRRAVNPVQTTTGQAQAHGKKLDYTQVSTTSSEELADLNGTLIRYTDH